MPFFLGISDFNFQLHQELLRFTGILGCGQESRVLMGRLHLTVTHRTADTLDT